MNVGLHSKAVCCGESHSFVKQQAATAEFKISNGTFQQYIGQQCEPLRNNIDLGGGPVEPGRQQGVTGHHHVHLAQHLTRVVVQAAQGVPKQCIKFSLEQVGTGVSAQAVYDLSLSETERHWDSTSCASRNITTSSGYSTAIFQFHQARSERASERERERE
jgi:hypothetical protein